MKKIFIFILSMIIGGLIYFSAIGLILHREMKNMYNLIQKDVQRIENIEND